MDTAAELKLTPCQENALMDITAWAYDKSSLAWTLSGAAGTGKTFVTKQILKHIPQGMVCVSAPTHKARKVIEGATGLAGFTLQKLLGLQPYTDVENFDINNVKFTAQGREKISNYQLIIIDEASMINTDMFDLLMDTAKKHRVKILFVGDHIQLPPVGENISKIFDAGAVDGVSLLKTPARQKPSNPLTIPLLLLRADIDPHSLKDIADYIESALESFGLGHMYTTLLGKPGAMFKHYIKRVPKLVNHITNEGYTITECGQEFADGTYKAFQGFDTDNMDFVKVLAYTNKQLSEYNKVIRARLLDNPEAPIVEGDILMSYATISAYPDNHMILTNSMEYIVTEVTTTMSSDGIEIFHVYMTGDDNSNTSINVVNPEDYFTFNEVHRIAHNKARKGNRWGAYYGFKNNHLILESLNKKFETNDLPKKDLDYAFGITVHKSQGSTYRHVAIDGNNIRDAYTIGMYHLEKEHGAENITPEMKAQLAKYTLRLLYVALSRASETALLYLGN